MENLGVEEYKKSGLVLLDREDYERRESIVIKHKDTRLDWQNKIN